MRRTRAGTMGRSTLLARGAQILVAPRRVAPNKNPARSPARAHFVSVNFTNALICAIVSSRPQTFLAPLAGRGPRPASENQKLGSVRGRFHKLRLAAAPPHPDLLHSPSQTGVNALMACGKKERACVAESEATQSVAVEPSRAPPPGALFARLGRRHGLALGSRSD